MYTSRLNKEYKYLILFLLIWIGFDFIPKGPLMMTWLGSIALCGWYSLRHRYEILYLLRSSPQANAIGHIYRVFWNIALIYLAVSLFNLPEIWSVSGLPFEISYIPRHFVIVFELFFPVGFGYALYKTDFIYRIPNWILIVIAVLGLLVHHISYVFLTVGSITLLAYRKNCMLLLPFTIFANLEQSAPVLGALLLIILSLNKNVFNDFFYGKTKSKFFLLIFISAFFIALSYSSFVRVLEGDSNSLWRWNVWINEYNSLKTTNFLGVGFGSAYVSYDIINSVENYNMYKTEDGNIYDGLFLVANHNSFLNMFYRMGIIGGLAFLTLLFQLIRWTILCYRHADKNMKKYIWCAFVCFAEQAVIVLFNPGLEMMQFAVNVCGSVAFLVAVLFKQCSIDMQKDNY